MQLFQVKSAPRLARMLSLAMARGMPPSRMPAGQRYLQKKGSPMPTSLTTVMGRTMTKSTKIPYFSQVRGRSRLVPNFLVGILWSSS